MMLPKCLLEEDELYKTEIINYDELEFSIAATEYAKRFTKELQKKYGKVISYLFDCGVTFENSENSEKNSEDLEIFFMVNNDFQTVGDVERVIPKSINAVNIENVKGICALLKEALNIQPVAVIETFDNKSSRMALINSSRESIERFFFIAKTLYNNNSAMKREIKHIFSSAIEKNVFEVGKKTYESLKDMNDNKVVFGVQNLRKSLYKAYIIVKRYKDNAVAGKSVISSGVIQKINDKINNLTCDILDLESGGLKQDGSVDKYSICVESKLVAKSLDEVNSEIKSNRNLLASTVEKLKKTEAIGEIERLERQVKTCQKRIETLMVTDYDPNAVELSYSELLNKLEEVRGDSDEVKRVYKELNKLKPFMTKTLVPMAKEKIEVMLNEKKAKLSRLKERLSETKTFVSGRNTRKPINEELYGIIGGYNYMDNTFKGVTQSSAYGDYKFIKQLKLENPKAIACLKRVCEEICIQAGENGGRATMLKVEELGDKESIERYTLLRNFLKGQSIDVERVRSAVLDIKTQGLLVLTSMKNHFNLIDDDTTNSKRVEMISRELSAQLA